MKYCVLTLVSLIFSILAGAQDLRPVAVYQYRIAGENGAEIRIDTVTCDAPEFPTELSAPVFATCHANPEGAEDYIIRYEWRVDDEIIPGAADSLQYTFNTSGRHVIQVVASFYDLMNTYMGESTTYNFTLTVQSSKLEFPNAFSPNGDGANDVLRAKTGFESITSFHAAVFTRQGKKIYEWDDVYGSWDGRYNGSYVNDGVYYLMVTARGADGQSYSIKKAITVLKGYTSAENSSGNE